MDNFTCILHPSLFQYNTKKSFTRKQYYKKSKGNKAVDKLRKTFHYSEMFLASEDSNKLGSLGGLDIYIKK